MSRTWVKCKDSRETSYYVENGVQPFRLEGFKGILYAYFYDDEIRDLRENWYSAIEMYREERQQFNKKK